MSAEFRSKLKRQLEILGLCLSQNYHRYMQMEDLTDLFGVELYRHHQQTTFVANPKPMI